MRLLSALIVSTSLTFASYAEAGPLEEAQKADSRLRKDERRLKKRHHIEAVIRQWEKAMDAGSPKERLAAAQGHADAWALLAHWSGRRADRARAKKEKASVERQAVALKTAKKKKSPKPRWLRHVDAKTVDGRLEIRLSVAGAFDITKQEVGDKRMFFDLKPVVVVRNALGTLDVGASGIERLRVGQYDDQTARLVVDFAGPVSEYRDAVHIVDGRTITIRLDEGPLGADPKVAAGPKEELDPREVVAKLKNALNEIAEDPQPLTAIVDEIEEAYPDVAVDLKRSTRKAARPRRPSLLSVRTVVIDAGHGGKDGGARRGRVKEKDINLAVAKKVGAKLKKAGIKVVYTRTKDEFISLRRRAQIANRSKADLFISIHANANRRKHVHGVETYYLNTATSRYARRLAKRENGHHSAEMLHPVDDHEGGMAVLPDNALGRDLRLVLADLAMRSATVESKRLAGYVQTSVVGSLSKDYDDVRDLGVKHALFYVLLGVRMPSVLIETGFVTNPKERARLSSRAYQEKLSTAIAGAVQRFVEEREDLAMKHGEGGLAVSFAAP